MRKLINELMWNRSMWFAALVAAGFAYSVISGMFDSGLQADTMAGLGLGNYMNGTPIH